MMMSAQTPCVLSSRIPQPGATPQQPGSVTKSPASLVPAPLRRPQLGLKGVGVGGFPEGRSSSTSSSSTSLAMKQASSFFSSPEEASDSRGAAQGTSVRDSAGTKTLELINPISPTKLVDDQLPSLLSMIIDGLPPFQINEFVDEAEERLNRYVKRYPNVPSLHAFLIAGLSSTAYGHPGIIDTDRLVAVSFNYALTFIVDDLLFDTPDESLQEQYGISPDVCESPQKIGEYLNHLDAIFGQVVPHNPSSLIETLTWESGREMLELSNPEWFNKYVEAVVEHHQSTVTSHADIIEGHNLWFQDLESYTVMRNGNVGGRFIHLILEFGKNTYLPDILRTSPYMEKVITATSIHLGFVNDIFSYHKESSLEQNPRNFITVLMKSEGKPFVETVHMAVDLVNAYTHMILGFKAEAWNSTLQNHLHEVIALIAGNVYYSSMEKRYRHPDSFFPELRDTTSSWKTLPQATKGR